MWYRLPGTIFFPSFIIVCYSQNKPLPLLRLNYSTFFHQPNPLLQKRLLISNETLTCFEFPLAITTFKAPKWDKGLTTSLAEREPIKSQKNIKAARAISNNETLLCRAVIISTGLIEFLINCPKNTFYRVHPIHAFWEWAPLLRNYCRTYLHTPLAQC